MLCVTSSNHRERPPDLRRVFRVQCTFQKQNDALWFMRHRIKQSRYIIFSDCAMPQGPNTTVPRMYEYMDIANGILRSIVFSLASSSTSSLSSRDRSCGAARIGRRRLEHKMGGLVTGGYITLVKSSITIIYSSVISVHTARSSYAMCFLLKKVRDLDSEPSVLVLFVVHAA